jgi:predicted SAM-dependent methyltransferase
MPGSGDSIKRLFELGPRRLRREAHRMRVALAPDERIHAYIDSEPVRKLQIGAGPNLLDGWLNTDRDRPTGGAYLDATRRFPIPDVSFDRVFCEHTIEHLSYEAGKHMLRECFRVLKPGGKVRIATPDLETVLSLYRGRDEELPARYIEWATNTFISDADGYRPSLVINNMFRNWGHKFIYDEETLGHVLSDAGFVDVRRFGCGQSDDPHLRGIESHGATAEDRELIRFETLVLQATRP